MDDEALYIVKYTWLPFALFIAASLVVQQQIETAEIFRKSDVAFTVGMVLGFVGFIYSMMPVISCGPPPVDNWLSAGAFDAAALGLGITARRNEQGWRLRDGALITACTVLLFMDLWIIWGAR